MAKIKIPFNGKEYSIDESIIASALAELKQYISTDLSGTGATISIGGTTYNIDSTKLSAATSEFISNLGAVEGSGSNIVIGGVEFGVDSAKISNIVSKLESVFNDLNDEVEVIKYTMGHTVEDGDYIYTYMGCTTLEEARNFYRLQVEDEWQEPWDQILSYFDGDEEAVWADAQIPGTTDATFVPADPQWCVGPISTEITGANVIKQEIDGIAVTTIRHAAFSDCTRLTSVLIPESITNIDNAVFKNCTSLTSISLPRSIMRITYSMFNGCTSLTSVTLPDSVTEIYGHAFNNSGLVKINIPASVTTIGADAFQNCKDLISIQIPDGLTEIDIGVFNNCVSLTSVTIPNSVTSICNMAFYRCLNLTDIYYNGSEEEWNAISISTHNERLLNATVHYNYTGE